MYYVYILKLDRVGDKEFYIGYTSDLKKRFNQHVAGENKTTRNRNPKLAYYEAYLDKYKALEREKNLKNSGSSYMGLMKRIGLK